MRNVHWLNALAAATSIVSFGPSSSSDAKSTAYDTDIVDDRRASGRFTLKTDVIDESSSRTRNSHGLPTRCVGKKATTRPAPMPMIVQTYSRAARGRDFIAAARPPGPGTV